MGGRSNRHRGVDRGFMDSWTESRWVRATKMCYSRGMPNAKGKIATTLDTVDVAAERRAKAAYPWRFQPGESGNPGGLSKFYWETRRLARDASPAVMARLIELALHADDERVASVCGVAVLDRGGIRPTDYNPSEDQLQQPSWDPGKLTREERAQFCVILEKLAKPD
jgi:hypothetical protein